MKAYSLTQYHQVPTNTAYFRVILHFLHHRYVFVCTMHIQAHFLGIRLHSFSGPLHMLGTRANTHPSPCWLFLTLLWFRKTLVCWQYIGYKWKSSKSTFSGPEDINLLKRIMLLLMSRLVLFCHQQCYYNSFKGYQNCLVRAGLLGSCNP